MSDKQKTVDAFLARVNKKCGEGTAATAKDRVDLGNQRFSSGSFDLDLALGGGYPYAKMTLIYGPQSSGKTLLITKACASVQKYCTKCRLFKTRCKCKGFEGGRALLVDTEGAFDLEWAIKNGFDSEKHIVMRPEYGEQAIDVIDGAIRERIFDLIIIDSIEHMVPKSELEKHAEEGVMGKRALMMNRAFRKWNNAFSSSKGRAPAMININQPRTKFVMFGDDLSLPCGMGQRFAASIELRMKTGKVGSVAGEATEAYIEISGTTAKNKTYCPKQAFEFQVALKDHSFYSAGDTDSPESLVKYGRKNTESYGQLIKMKDKHYVIPELDLKVPTKDQLYVVLNENEDIQFELSQLLLERFLI